MLSSWAQIIETILICYHKRIIRKFEDPLIILLNKHIQSAENLFYKFIWYGINLFLPFFSIYIPTTSNILTLLTFVAIWSWKSPQILNMIIFKSVLLNTWLGMSFSRDIPFPRTILAPFLIENMMSRSRSRFF